jgi:amidase
MQPTLGAYKAIAKQKKTEQAGKIPQEWKLNVETQQHVSSLLDVPATCGILNNAEVDITSNHDATALIGKIKEGVWSVEQVTVAFCKRAAIAHQLVCTHLSSICFGLGLAADLLDENGK